MPTDDLTNAVATLTVDLTALGTAVTAVENELAAANAQVASLTAQVAADAGLAGQVTSLQTKIAAAVAALNGA